MELPELSEPAKLINSNRPRTKTANPITARNPKGGGRPKGFKVTDWDNLMPRILEMMANGESLKRIVCLEGMPSFNALNKELQSERWAGEYEQAKQIRASYYGFKMEEIIDGLEDRSVDAMRGRSMGDLIKWRMAQLSPREYHDKVITQTVTHKVEHSTRERLERADNRHLQARVIDVEDYEVVGNKGD